MTTENIVRVTSYLRDGAFAEANQDARVAALSGRVVPTTTIVAETLTPTGSWKWRSSLQLAKQRPSSRRKKPPGSRRPLQPARR